MNLTPYPSITLATIVTFLGAIHGMAIEEASYNVVTKEGSFEIREYEPHILAETLVEGGLEEAGDQAFNKLFRYISGKNQSREKVAMTAPVSQSAAGEKIKMTSPVGQQRAEDKWAVSFMMPASHTMETLPEPEDPTVSLREVPARRMAAVRYSGFWSEKKYRVKKLALEAWMDTQELVATGEPVWARYNPPFTPWFLRRNEILIPIGAVDE